jgi:CBS domain-containing membrane protein
LNQRTQDPTPTQKATIQPQDIQDVLDAQTQLLDISEYDLQKIILEAQHKASERQTQALTCADIMSKDVVSLQQDEDIHSALEKFKHMNLMSLPVIDTEQHLVGTLALYEVVEWFKHATDLPYSWKHQVKHIMLRQVVTVQPQQSIQDLVPYFVERSFNYIPVVEQQRLVGIISRADMIAVLNQQLAVKTN